MGELTKRKKTAVAQASEEFAAVQSMGGRMHVRWDETAPATPHGQLVYFAEFLATAGIFDEWVKSCPLSYSSPNASNVRDVLGTLMLGILAGSKRYAHIAAIRGDQVAAKALGLSKIVSEDSVRRGLKAMEPTESSVWMDEALRLSVVHALERPWILDLDATIKTLYGHQEGAEVGYNPHKRGRPGHALHTYWIGNLRLVLDTQVYSGKQSSSGHAKLHLSDLLEGLGDKGPTLVRGDCGYGNQDIIEVCERARRRYLLRLRKTSNVRKLIERAFNRDDWQAAGQGWQAREDQLRLSGWSKERRVVMLRRRIEGDVALIQKGASGQQVLALGFNELQDEARQLWEYTVLVTDAPYELGAIGQLYRDRCDCENGFDELKNQWGWGGFTTKDLHRSELTARAVALVYNWWSWYVRAANPKARREALTSRPLLLSAVGRVTQTAGRVELHLTPMHAKVGLIKAMVANVQEAIRHVKKAAAEQLNKFDCWHALVRYISDKITGQTLLPTGPPVALVGG